MGVFLRHGKPVKSDSLAGTYSNPVFQRVFDAQDRMWELLQDVFTPLEEVELPRKVSPATIRQIRALKQQGIKTRKLSELFGVSPNQIRAYCRKKATGSTKNEVSPPLFVTTPAVPIAAPLGSNVSTDRRHRRAEHGKRKRVRRPNHPK